MNAAPGLSLQPVSPWRRAWRPFWSLPAAIMLVSVGLGVLVPVLDRHLLPSVAWVFSGQPDGARSLLGTVSSAMISVTGLVFSVTMVVLQLASSQFSPRVLGNFLDGRVAQVTLGVFTGSFLYSLTVLRVVRDESDGSEAFVPHTAVTLSYVYVLASVGMFLAFIAHITSMVQVSRVISDLGRATLEGLAAADGGRDDQPDGRESPVADALRTEGTALRVDDRHGHLVAIDAARMVALAEEHDLVVHLDVGIGDFLVPGQVAGRVVAASGGDVDQEVSAGLLGCLSLERERVLAQDPLFGTRQLVDIAERALSPGTNDPTTATQVVHELHLVLRHLVTRPDPPSVLRDEGGSARLTYRTQTLARHLDLAVDEIVHYGADAAQVPATLASMLDELRSQALPEHRSLLDDARGRVA